MDQLRALRVFLAVIDHGSLAAAARALDLAPAVVTRQLKELEQSLNTRLLHRTTRSLALTEAGERYAERVRPVLDQLSAADDEVGSLDRQPRGTLRISTPIEFATAQIIPRIPKLQTLYPQLTVDIEPPRLGDAPDPLADVSILIARPSALEGDFVARPLAMTTGMLCGSPAYLREHGTPRHPRDLAHHACLIAARPDLSRRFLLMPDDPADGAPFEFEAAPTDITSSSPEALRVAAIHGMGLVGMLSCVAERDIRAGALVRVLPQWSASRWNVFAAYLSRRHVPRRVRAFLEFMAQELGDPGQDPWLDGTTAARAGRA